MTDLLFFIVFLGLSFLVCIFLMGFMSGVLFVYLTFVKLMDECASRSKYFGINGRIYHLQEIKLTNEKEC